MSTAKNKYKQLNTDQYQLDNQVVFIRDIQTIILCNITNNTHIKFTAWHYIL